MNRSPGAARGAVPRAGRGAAWILPVLTVPNARKSRVDGWQGDALKIRIAAPAVENRANRALLEFLSDRLGLPQNAVHLVSGGTSRRKRIRVEGLDDTALRLRLAPDAPD